MKKFYLLAALTLFLVLANQGNALAAGEGAGWGYLEAAGRWFNLIVLFGLIFYFVRKPAAEFFSGRRQEIQRQIAEASRLGEEARQKMAAVEARLKGLDAELAEIRGQAERESELERQRILEQAEKDAEKIIVAARREVEGMTLAARKELKEYVGRLVTDVAREKISSELGSQQEERLVERFVTGLGGKR